MQGLQASGSMTSRERFLEVMRFGQPDRVPYFEEGIRDEVMTQLADQPNLVRGMMTAQGELAAALTEKVLKDVTIDAAIFSEPIGGNEGPLSAFAGNSART